MVGCTDDFADLNTDPNNPTTVPTSYLLTQAQRALVDRVLGEGFAGVGCYGLHYCQMWSQTQYSNVTRYDDVNTSFYGFYNGGMADLQNIIDLNTNEETAGTASSSGANENQIAVANIMLVWAFQNMTDVWGDIPYTDALLGTKNLNPVYDTQQSIYANLVTRLDQATSSIKGGSIDGDIIFGGDMDKWAAFAQSLKLRIGMRASNADEGFAKATVASALSTGVMTSNGGNAVFNYLGAGESSNNTFYEDFLTRTDYAISEGIVNMMSGDPRVSVYAQPTQASINAGSPAYVGMPYGLNQENAGAIPVADVSHPGIAFIGYDTDVNTAAHNPSAGAVMMSYSEVLFVQAEAMAREWMTGDADAMMAAAIRASMEQWGVDATAIDDYFANTTFAALTTANASEVIGINKYLALYGQGAEGWAEWRRLDFPALSPPIDGGIESSEIPRRRGYPQDEFSLNLDNYNAAIDRQWAGADDLNGRVWWDQ